MRPNKAVVVALTLFLGSVAYGQTNRTLLPYQDVHLSPERRATDLVSRMTLEEKAAQSINTAPGIPRLGVPPYDYWSEGLHGVAWAGYSTLFPQAIGMAATWDAPLLKGMGDVVSTEARAKYNEAVRHDVHSIFFGLTFWSPNVNIFRDPRWGRGQETYGEDPFLTSMLALNFVRGMQGPDPMHPRVIATPKHFAVHSGPESERHQIDVQPSPHDLWETYLPAFRSAIVDGKAGSIMCAYNKIEGQPACASDLLLKEVLRTDWKFAGFVTSDCDAIDDFFRAGGNHYSPDSEHAAAAGILAGTDTNCGATYLALSKAVKQGLLTEADVNRTVERLFVARIRLGLFDPPATAPYAEIPFSQDRSPAHLALSAKASREAMVLLKNDGILPLAKGRYKNIAVIGPNAASLSALEGNYSAVPKYPEMPVDALRKEFAGAKIVYAQGAPYADSVPLPLPRTMLHPAKGSAQQGLKAEYFAGSSFDGKPITTRVDPEIDFDWTSASPAEGVPHDHFAVRWTGVIVAPAPGDYDWLVRFTHCYPCENRERFTVRIDGKIVGRTDAKAGKDSNNDIATTRFHVSFADTAPHSFEVDYMHEAPLFGGGISLQWTPPAGLLQKEALAVASKSDLVIAMVGLSRELEGEEMPLKVTGFFGGDRTDLVLPAAQQQMLEQVAATGKPLVVVLLNGSALAVNWAQQHANAVLEAWYPGEFGGKAIAETLAGKNNPAGRLPITFYSSVDQLPPFSDYAMKGRTYRYFAGEPLYRFGYGLSYSQFAYSGLKLSTTNLTAGEMLTAEVEVKNISKLAGEEVAELYLMPPADGNGGLSPRLQMEGFQRIPLKAGESRHVTFRLDPRRLSEVDAQGVRAVQPGRYKISIGGAQPDDPRAPTAAQSAVFTIKGTHELPR